MSAVPMSGGMMPMAWMPMRGQSWMATAASFLGMWILMMAAMMLPSLAVMLWADNAPSTLRGQSRSY